jgi:site-specific recombinase XerD
MLIEEKHLAPATINQRLAAVRRLTQEAADNGLVHASVAAAIPRVRGIRQQGVCIGKWMPAANVRELLGTPAADSGKGIRDHAILAVLLGCRIVEGDGEPPQGPLRTTTREYARFACEITALEIFGVS